MWTDPIGRRQSGAHVGDDRRGHRRQRPSEEQASGCGEGKGNQGVAKGHDPENTKIGR